MKTVMYVDCTRGIASDMFVAALLDCFEDKEAVLRELQLNICNNMSLTVDFAKSYDRTGLLFTAKDNTYKSVNGINAHCVHSHSDLTDVHSFIDGTTFSQNVKNAAKGVYDIIAKAEAEAHGAAVDSVHFHEVGQKRAVACIVCACALVDKLNADRVVFSGINAGYGKVICAHGEVDVPAPATAVILKSGIPHFYIDAVGRELCTPTGAALAKYFASSFVAQTGLSEFADMLPTAAVARGVGLGRRDIGIANGVTVTLTGE